MSSKKLNLYIEQGATFDKTVNFTDLDGEPTDFTGYTGASLMKKWFTSSTSYDITVTVGNGTVTLHMDAADTSSVPPGRYVYDVELTSTHEVVRVLEGIITVSPGVTL